MNPEALSEEHLFDHARRAADLPAGNPVDPIKASTKGRKKKKKKVNTADGTVEASSGAPLGSSRGVETLFRISYMVNMQLSGIADAKANIMISINGLILSIILATLAPKIDSNPWLLIPASVLLIGCLVSIVFAVLAARPRVAGAHDPGSDPSTTSENLLFFGYFSRMSPFAYEAAMTALLTDVRRLYPVMIRDLHVLGGVLDRKFRLLQISYTVFIVGLMSGVLMFLAAFVSVASA